MKKFVLGVLVGSMLGGATGAMALNTFLKGDALFLINPETPENPGVFAHGSINNGGALILYNSKDQSNVHIVSTNVSVSDENDVTRVTMSKYGITILDEKKRIAAILTADKLKFIPEKERKLAY